MSWLKRIRLLLCSLSVNMLAEHKTSVMSIKQHEPAQKIRAAREYMRSAHNLCAQLINACITSVPSKFTVDSCGFVSIRSSEGLLR